MTILQALDGYYNRMAERGEAEAPGFSREKIGFAIEIAPDGSPVGVIDLRSASGKKLVPQLLSVPAAVKRTAGILPNLLWDKSAYVLGCTAGEGKRTVQEHEAFKGVHLQLLADADDPGLVALRRFLETWTPGRFDEPPFHSDMLDANIVFRLQGENGFIHQRVAARALLSASAQSEGALVPCLVTGRPSPPQRLHPTIKGVNGAQSSGAALVSFNLDAFTSYGKDQGENAPTSQQAAFRYGAALNGMLERTSRNRLTRGIGDATVVFWADTSDTVGEEGAQAAEAWFSAFAEPPDDADEAKKVRDGLEQVLEGRPIEALDPRLSPGTRFHVLGLAPNAARLSVRYWLTDDFGVLTERFARHYRALHIEPTPRGWSLPSLNLILARTTALLGKFGNIPDGLAGEVTRDILTGAPYPRTLLSNVIQRLRAGDDPGSGWHAAVIKACINTSHSEMEVSVALEPDNPSSAYQLGRLFAVLEAAQFAALGHVNAPIGDRYYAAASATPARVFGPLLRGLKHHVSDARKRGQGGWIEPKVAEIMGRLPASIPKTLRLEDQGRFAVGYYHERSTRTVKVDGTAPNANISEEEND